LCSTLPSNGGGRRCATLPPLSTRVVDVTIVVIKLVQHAFHIIGGERQELKTGQLKLPAPQVNKAAHGSAKVLT